MTSPSVPSASGAWPRSAAARAAAVFLLWTVFGLAWSASSIVDGEGELRTAVAHIVPFYWCWALLTPAVLHVAARLARESASWPRRSAGAVVVAPAAALAHGALYLAALALLGVQPLGDLGARFLSYLLRHGGGDVATFLALVGVCFLVEAERRAREREVVAAELATRLARADLELLRWRLQPHFLFNALNTLSTMVLRQDATAATHAIDLMARYLRGVLREEADPFVPLSVELEAVRRYVDIETLRFGDALRVRTDVAADVLDAPVPGTILQPLVENAVRHARGAREGRGAITITAARVGGAVRVTVADPGGGPEAGRGGAGFGLRYVRERLRLLYGTLATFDIAVGPAGTVATLDLPLELRPTA